MLLVMTLFLKCQLLKKSTAYKANIKLPCFQLPCSAAAGVGQEFHMAQEPQPASCSCMPSCAVQGRERPFCRSRALFQRQGADTSVNRSALPPNASLLLSQDSWNWPGSTEPCSFHGGMQFDLIGKSSDTHYFTLCKPVHLLFFPLLWALIIRRVVITFGLILCCIHFVAAIRKYPQF